jgi:hypothetical protein
VETLATFARGRGEGSLAQMKKPPGGFFQNDYR